MSGVSIAQAELDKIEKNDGQNAVFYKTFAAAVQEICQQPIGGVNVREITVSFENLAFPLQQYVNVPVFSLKGANGRTSRIAAVPDPDNTQQFELVRLAVGNAPASHMTCLLLNGATHKSATLSTQNIMDAVDAQGVRDKKAPAFLMTAKEWVQTRAGWDLKPG